MPTVILKALFAVMLMIVVGALLRPSVATTEHAKSAAIGLAETPASGATFQAAQPASVNPISVTKIITSEPLLLLLMGTLLITLGGSIRRLTKSRSTPRAGLPRQT